MRKISKSQQRNKEIKSKKAAFQAQFPDTSKKFIMSRDVAGYIK